MTQFKPKAHLCELCKQWSVWAKVSCYRVFTDNKIYRAVMTGCVCIVSESAEKMRNTVPELHFRMELHVLAGYVTKNTTYCIK